MVSKLMKYLGEYKKYLVLCVVFAFGEVICELLIPLMMSHIVDIGIPEQNLGYIASIGGIMVLMSAAAIGFGVANAKISSEASQGFGANIRKAMFAQIEQFSFANIDKFSSASLVTRMTNDVNQMQGAIMMTMRLLTRAPLMLISALVIAVSINAKLSLSIFVAIAIFVVIIPIIMRTAGKLFSNMQKKLDALNGTVQENLIAIRVVKAFVRAGYEKTKFKKSNDELMEAAMKAGNLMAVTMPLMMLAMNGTTLAVIWIGGGYVGAGAMGTGELMSFISYITQILMSVMMFSMIFVMLTRARASAGRILEVLSTVPTIQDSPAVETRRKAAVRQGQVEFRDVSFRYSETGGDVLSHVSFAAQPGQMVGIVGGTGSGKTSLVNLIPRFYDATGGEILVDGVNVKDYTQEDLRDGIGMVMQSNNLFSGTIRDNILWGKEDATADEVVQAATDAQAHDFISSFPNGYETDLGQGGVNVSGGQKQRLCIARAMLKKPAILILDDSTSAVDMATEAKIRQSFTRNFKDSTVIIVAQRISSVKDADQIIVLDDGVVAGIGTHDELLESNDIYREICSSQLEGGLAQ
ncbi:ABC transporter ATP-binding protein/permease [Ruminococcaceae bacterium OttesenSCG-928-L11]|nr:ABC transporter ATP-binding protein/permease [Ruminococcaceae bacterium OttesenSCG-928-L11]